MAKWRMLSVSKSTQTNWYHPLKNNSRTVLYNSCIQKLRSSWQWSGSTWLGLPEQHPLSPPKLTHQFFDRIERLCFCVGELFLLASEGEIYSFGCSSSWCLVGLSNIQLDSYSNYSYSTAVLYQHGSHSNAAMQQYSSTLWMYCEQDPRAALVQSFALFWDPPHGKEGVDAGEKIEMLYVELSICTVHCMHYTINKSSSNKLESFL